MVKGNGLTRGDKRRNERISGLREAVRPDRAVLAIDLGEDKQAAVLVDHDCRVLARRTVSCKVGSLGAVLDWAAVAAGKRGFVGVTVSCEPTGHRWRALMGMADARAMSFVCVQPLAVHVSREADDYTRDKTDHRDALLIGRLTVRLDCYLPERADELWARLRHLGARRNELIVASSSCRLQMADLLACAWPAVLAAAADPFRAKTWLACLAAALADGADVASWHLAGRAGLLQAVRRELPRFGASRVCHRIVGAVWDALSDTAGVPAQRPGALERVHLVLADWSAIRVRLADVETRMREVLDRLGLTELVCSIDGLSAVGAAAILAETGDLKRFDSARAVVKHAGLSPSENTSATMRGTTRISRRGRPQLRTAAWRAVWGGLPANHVLAAKFTHLTTREQGRLAPGQARAACAAALLRWLHAVITTGQRWDPAIAAGLHPTRRSDLTRAA